MRRFERTLRFAMAVITMLILAVSMAALPLKPALATTMQHRAGCARQTSAAPCHGMVSGKSEKGPGSTPVGSEHHRDCYCNRDDRQNGFLSLSTTHSHQLSAIAARIFPALARISDSYASSLVESYTSLTFAPALRPPIR